MQKEISTVFQDVFGQTGVDSILCKCVHLEIICCELIFVPSKLTFELMTLQIGVKLLQISSNCF